MILTQGHMCKLKVTGRMSSLQFYVTFMQDKGYGRGGGVNALEFQIL